MLLKMFSSAFSMIWHEMCFETFKCLSSYSISLAALVQIFKNISAFKMNVSSQVIIFQYENVFELELDREKQMIFKYMKKTVGHCRPTASA